MLILMLFFVIDCKLWTKAKVNYVFVFEFDTRHHLDWRQLAEVRCVTIKVRRVLTLIVAMFFLVSPWLVCLAKLHQIWS
jgi:hypothetical protein